MKLIFLAMAGFIFLSGCVDEKVEAKKFGAVNTQEAAVILAKKHFKSDFKICGDSLDIYRVQSWEAELEACPKQSSFSEDELKICFRDGYQVSFDITDTRAVSSALSKACVHDFYVEIAKNDGEAMNYSYDTWQ